MRYFLLAAVLLATLPMSGCSNSITGSGVSKTEARQVTPFRTINAEGVANLKIEFAETPSLEIEADDNLLSLIKTEVRNDTLTITMNNISPKIGPTLTIKLAELSGLKVSGVSTAQVSGIANEKLAVEASGASKITLSGSCENFDAIASGASTIDAKALSSKSAHINVSGASSADLTVSQDLFAEASGASEVRYGGSPKNVKTYPSGSSSILSR